MSTPDATDPAGDAYAGEATMGVDDLLDRIGLLLDDVREVLHARGARPASPVADVRVAGQALRQLPDHGDVAFYERCRRVVRDEVVQDEPEVFAIWVLGFLRGVPDRRRHVALDAVLSVLDNRTA